MKITGVGIKSLIVSSMFLFAATAGWAANGVWNGTVDALWTSSANWSASPYPSGNDTASFTNNGNGQTLIDIAGLSNIKYITFDSPTVAAYTNGIGAANSQTLIMVDGGEFKLTDTAANSQLFNCGVQLGANVTAQNYSFKNDNTAQTLTFNNVFGSAAGGGTAGDKTLTISGAGNTTVLGNIVKGGAAKLILNDISSGVLTLAGSNVITTLNINGGPNSIVDIGSQELFLNNVGGNVLNCTQGGVINGTGKIRMSTNSGLGGYDYADLNVAAGKTLVINPEITGLGGIETWSGSGTLVLNGINTFVAHIVFGVAGSTISVGKIGNSGSLDSNLGKGTNINFNAANSKLIYTGVGETSNRKLLINNTPVILDQSGASGTLTFSGSPTLSAGAKTLTLQGSSAGIGTFSSPLINSSGTLSILKAGSGTWIFSVAHTYSGTTTINGGTLLLTGANGTLNASTGYTINAGGTLLLENLSTANNTNRLRDASAITLSGGTLSLTNNGGAVNYRENAGGLIVGAGGNSTIATTEAIAGQTNTLTFTSLAYAGGKLNFTGTGIGVSDRNRIFMGGVSDGLIGTWATVNGTSYAAYSSTLGVYAAAPETTFTDIAAEGGLDPESIIPDNGALWARINLPGVSGPITLQGEWTNSIGFVVQNTTTNTTIAMYDGVTNKLLQAAGLAVAEGKASLTVGENENDGYLSALTAAGTLVLENNSVDNPLTVNAVIVNNTTASALSKIGAGTVVLKGTNTYSGNTYISEGILNFAGNSEQTVSGAISGAGSLLKSGDGLLNLNAANTFTGGLTINQGTVTTALAGGLGVAAVTNNGTLNLTGGALTYTGLSTSLAGSGTNNVTLAIGTTATVILNGNYSDFTGLWNIGVGRLAGQSKIQMNGLDNSAATINILSNGTIYCSTPITHNATLVLEGGNTYEALGQLRMDAGASWAGPITLIGPITGTEDAFFGNGAASTISGVIDDLGSGFTVDKLSGGTLTFSGANTYSGPTWVKAGAISVAAMGTIGGGASPLGSQTSAEAGKVRLGNAAVGTLIYTGAGETTDRMIDLAGTTFGGTLAQSGTGLLNLTGGMMISGTGNKTFTLQGSTTGTGEFAGAITNGLDSMISVTKAGTGIWTLSGANTYTGLTTVTAGTLSLRGPTALPSLSDISINAATVQILQDGSGNNGTISAGNNITLNAAVTATIDVGNAGSANTGNTVAFGALNNGAPGSTQQSTINFTGTNAYLQSFTSLGLTSGTGQATTLKPTTTSVTILGNVLNRQASGGYDTLTLDGTSPSNSILGVISDAAHYTGQGSGDTRITKSNTSTWTLAGANTYRGNTTVNGGTLLITGSIITNAIVNNGGTLGGSGMIGGNVTVNAGGNLALGADTLSMGGTLALNGNRLFFDISNAATGKVAVAGALTLNSANIVELAFPAGPVPAGTYTLMTFASKSGDGIFTLARGYPNATLTWSDTSLILTVGAGGTQDGLTWNGNVSGNWDGAEQNWLLDGAPANFTVGDGVTFTDAASRFIVESGLAVSPFSLVFNSGSNYTVNAIIDGSAPVVKLGSGTATLTGLSSTFNPTSIAVGAGTLALGGTSQLNSGLYATDIFNNGTLGFASSVAQTLSGVISGTGTLTMSGSGMLTLSGSNTYTGATIVNAGVLRIQNNNALGTTAGGTTVTNATLELAGDITTPAEGLTLYGTLSSPTGTNTYGGAVSTLGNASAINVGTDSLLILSASNAGAGTFIKTGNGTLRFTKDPNNTGAMTINGGVAEITNGTTDGNVIINSGATFLATAGNVVNDANTVTVNAGGTYDLRGSDSISSLNGAGLVTKGTTGGATLTVGGNNNGSGNFSGVIQNGLGTLGFTKAGTGTQTLSGINTFSGNMSSAGTLLLTGTGQFGAGIYAGTIANTGMFVHDSSATQTLSGVISGTAGVLRKTGSGKLILSGVNTYTGSTSLSNGVLVVVTGGSCASSAFTNAAAAGQSATFGVLVTDNTKQWSCSSLVIANAGVSTDLDFDFGTVAPSTTLAPLKVNNALTFTTTPTVTVKASNIAGGPGTVYPLMTWTSTSGTAPTAVTVTSSLRPIAAHLTVTGNTLNLVIDSNSGPLLWTDGGSKTWNTDSGNMIWQDRSGALIAYDEATLPGDTVVFSDSNLVADATVTLNSIVTPGGVSITNDAYQYTISGSGGIAGPVGLTKSGTNTLILATANSFFGHTIISGGTLKLANASALPAVNTLAMENTGTLDMNGYPAAVSNISASVAGNIITDSSAGAGATALSILNQTTTIAATIKDGASKSVAVSIANNLASFSSFSTTSSNTFSGGLLLKNGLSLGSGTRLRIMTPVTTDGTPGNIISSPFGTGPITIGEAATDKAQILFDTVANNTVVNDIVVNTSLGTDVAYALRVDTAGNSVRGAVQVNADLTVGGPGVVTLDNVISGTGGVKLAGGTVTANLYGQNTYKGKTTIPSGSTLSFTSIGNVGSGPSALGDPDDAAAGTITVGNGTTTGMNLLYRGMGHTTDRVLELAGTTGGLTVNHSGTNLLKFTSDLLMSGSGAKRLALTGANNSTGEVAGVISDNAGGKLNLYKDSTTSTWILSGANTFTDTVNINAGKLIIKNSLALGLGNKTVIINQGSSGNPQLHLDGSAGPITLGTNLAFQTSNQTSGSLHNTKGTNTIEGNITMTGGGGDTIITSWADKLYISGKVTPNTSVRNLRLRGNGDGEISGVIANGVTTNMPVFKDSGTGTWTLSGTNTYSGATTISSGTLAVGNDQALGVSNVVNLTGGNLGGAVGTWSITNTVNAQNNAGIITEGTLILTGLVTNNAALTKTGSGTLLLNGAKTGTGALTVSEGVFGGTGTIAGTVTNLATITAADTNSIGTLTVTNLVMASNSTIIWNCNAVTQDIIKVTGTLTLPDVATVVVNEEMAGDIGLTPRVLFTFATGPAPDQLSNWVVVGGDRTGVRVENNQVVLFRLPGTIILMH